MLPFLSLVTESELMRNPTVKAEQEASGHALTGLLLSYPVHQACDILFCKGNVVPVGKDQLPHIEQTRQIARRFNERYGQVFPEPHGLLTDAVEIPGLDGPQDVEELRQRHRPVGHGGGDRQAHQEVQDRLRAHDHLRQGEPPRRVGPADHGGAAPPAAPKQDIAAEIGNDGAGALKRYVTESVNAYLAPIRERRRELEGQPEMVREILHEGQPPR